jgi:hypothetical protein
MQIDICANKYYEWGVKEMGFTSKSLRDEEDPSMNPKNAETHPEPDLIAGWPIISILWSSASHH